MLITNATTGNAIFVRNSVSFNLIKDKPHYQCICNEENQPYCDFVSDMPQNVAGYCTEMCPCDGIQTHEVIK